jgi:hypothetical protein
VYKDVEEDQVLEVGRLYCRRSCIVASRTVLNSTMNTDTSVYLVKESILKAAAYKGLLILQDLRYVACLGTF